MRLEIRPSRCQPPRDLGPGWGALDFSKSNREPGEAMEKRRGRVRAEHQKNNQPLRGYGGAIPGNGLGMGKAEVTVHLGEDGFWREAPWG